MSLSPFLDQRVVLVVFSQQDGEFPVHLSAKKFNQKLKVGNFPNRFVAVRWHLTGRNSPELFDRERESEFWVSGDPVAGLTLTLDV